MTKDFFRTFVPSYLWLRLPGLFSILLILFYIMNYSALKAQCTEYPVFTSISGTVNCGGTTGELCFRATPDLDQQNDCSPYIIRFAYDPISLDNVQATFAQGGSWNGPTSPGPGPEFMEFDPEENVLDGEIIGCFQFLLTSPSPVPIAAELIIPNDPSSSIPLPSVAIGDFITIGEPGETKEITEYIGAPNGLLPKADAAINGQQVKIEGTLEVNDSYTFGYDDVNGSVANTIIMGPGARIIVEGNESLGFERADIYTCNTTWDGILVKSQADLQMLRTTLTDATVGVELQDGASFEMNRTRFIGNDIGVGAFGPNLKNIDFTGWSGFGGLDGGISDGQTGIHLENVAHFDESEIGNKLWLENLETGVHLDNSNATITDYTIVDCGTGVYEVSGNDFLTCGYCSISECDYGIRTVGTSVFNVMNSDLARNNFDIHKKPKSENEMSTINENHFYGSESYSASGINVFAQSFHSDMPSTISMNQSLHALRYNVHLSGIGKGLHNWTVQDNGIMDKLGGGAKGANVYFLDLVNSSILENMDVVSTGQNFVVDGGYGIGVMDNVAEGAVTNVSLDGARNSSVVCNDFSRTAFSGNIFPSAIASNIYVENECGGSDIRGNSMSQSNGDGLGQYNLVYGNPSNTYANTNRQDFKGNIFDLSQEGSEKARNYGPFFLAFFNQYRVDDSNVQGDENFPFFESAFDGWFVVPPNPEDDYGCGSGGGGIIGGETTPEMLIKAVEDGLALQDAGLAGFYGQEVAYDSRLKLYRNLVLLDEQDALPVEYDSIYNDLSSSDVAPFVTFERNYVQVVEATPVMLAKYVTALLDEIIAIKWLVKDPVTGEVTIIYDQQAVYDQKMAELRQLSSEYGDLVEAQQIQIDALLPALNTINEAANNQTTQSGQNQYEINKLLLYRYNSSFTGFDTSGLQTIISISDQCPVDGGEAVHTARALRTEAEGEPREYDDQCVSGQSYREKTGQGHSSAVLSDKLVVSPNPASEDLTLYIPEDFIGDEILVTNMYGQIVHRMVVNGNQKISLDASSWPNGIYFAVSSLGAKAKFIISH